MIIIRLALKSVLNRRFTALLTVFSIALSVMLLLGVERLRQEARSSFANTISGTDLVVGARSGTIQLLLYSVFRIGNATNNISWQSYRDIVDHPQIKWTIPLSLGDSHRGYRVMGTNLDYFKHYRFARDRALEFAEGKPFTDLYDAVLGAEVAEALDYRLGQAIVIAHGVETVSFALHEDKPFRVVGILERTGTPVDRTVHVRLEGIEALHIDWVAGMPIPGLAMSAEQVAQRDLTPKAITAFLVGLHSKVSTFRVQRFINDYAHEPLLAIIPGVALQELWDLMRIAEQALLAVSSFVVLVGLTGMVTVLLTSLNERRREMAILRAAGARPMHVFGLIMGEAMCMTLGGITLGVALLYVLFQLAQPLIQTRFGLFMAIGSPSAYELILLGAVLVAGLLISAVPSYRAYRYSLADGMTVRL
ncbi:MAG: ABC transporter permease [Gammaproteobacteria bacterium]